MRNAHNIVRSMAMKSGGDGIVLLDCRERNPAAGFFWNKNRLLPKACGNPSLLDYVPDRLFFPILVIGNGQVLELASATFFEMRTNWQDPRFKRVSFKRHCHFHLLTSAQARQSLRAILGFLVPEYQASVPVIRRQSFDSSHKK